jgi:hypothetical protein
MTSKLIDDLFLQTRNIPNIDVRIRLKRCATPSYQVIIERASFFARKHLISSKVLELHSKSVEKSPYLYPFTISDIRNISIPANAVSSITENLFASNRLPQRIEIGLLDATALNGSHKKNPFDFTHFYLSNLTLSVDQNRLEYRNINLSFDDEYLTAFQSLLSELNSDRTTLGLDRKSWLDGNTFFGSSLCGYTGLPSFVEQDSSLKLDFTFSTPLAQATVAVILSQTQSVLKIDKFHSVEIDTLGVV